MYILIGYTANDLHESLSEYAPVFKTEINYCKNLCLMCIYILRKRTDG